LFINNVIIFVNFIGSLLTHTDSLQRLAMNGSRSRQQPSVNTTSSTNTIGEPVSSPFGYRGKGGSLERSNYARMLMEGAPVGSVTQRERRDVEEETISRSMIGRLEYEGNNQDGGQDSDAVLNLDSVSEKVRYTGITYIDVIGLQAGEAARVT